MLKPEFKVNLSNFENQIRLMKSERLPRAASTAINRTLIDARDNIRAEIASRFDSPTRWSLMGVRIQGSTKYTLRGRVYIDDEAGKGVPADRFLLAQVMGGERRYKKFENALKAKGILASGEYAVPTKHVPKDQHGNVPGQLVVQILSYLQAFGEQGYRSNMTDKSRARKKLNERGVGYFIGTLQNGKAMGIYERRVTAWGDAVRPLFLFVRTAKYQKRLDFYGIAERTMQERYGRHYIAAFEAMGQ